MIRLQLPLPPSLNKYYRTFKGRMLVSEDGRAYCKEVGYLVMQARAAQHLTGRLGFHVALTVPDNRKRDLDNVLKVLQDALAKAGVYEDDSQIDDLRVRRIGFDKANGGVVVTIWELNIDANAVFTAVAAS